MFFFRCFQLFLCLFLILFSYWVFAHFLYVMKEWIWLLVSGASGFLDYSQFVCVCFLYMIFTKRECFRIYEELEFNTVQVTSFWVLCFHPTLMQLLYLSLSLLVSLSFSNFNESLFHISCFFFDDIYPNYHTHFLLAVSPFVSFNYKHKFISRQKILIHLLFLIALSKISIFKCTKYIPTDIFEYIQRKLRKNGRISWLMFAAH